MKSAFIFTANSVSLVFGCEVQVLGRKWSIAARKLKVGVLPAVLIRAVQLYGSVFVVERYVTVEAALYSPSKVMFS